MADSRPSEARQIGKFAAVGLVNTAVDVATFAGLVELLAWRVVQANLLSYGAGILNSFLMNKFWTFRDTTPLKESAQPLVRFCVFNLSGLLISTAVVAMASLSLAPLAAKSLSVIIVFGWNYATSRRWVFDSSTP